MTELGDPATAAKACNIVLNECVHVECVVVMERVRELMNGVTKTKKGSGVIKVRVSNQFVRPVISFQRDVPSEFETGRAGPDIFRPGRPAGARGPNDHLAHSKFVFHY
jgi:hypothetical protein